MLSINPSALQLAGYRFAQYQLLVPAGTPLSALLMPEYWIPLGFKFRRFDEVRAVADDGSFDVLLTVANDQPVRGAPNLLPNVQMRVLRLWTPEEEAEVAPIREEAAKATEPDFSVGWGGKAEGWRVVGPTGKVLRAAFASEKEAQGWLDQHLAGRRKAA